MGMNDFFNAAYFIGHISFEILFLYEVGVELTSHYYLSGPVNSSQTLPVTCPRHAQEKSSSPTGVQVPPF